VVHGLDGNEGQESLDPYPGEDFTKHYLLVKHVDDDGYAAQLHILPGDKIYGMSVPNKVEGKPAVKDTRVSNTDVLEHIEKSVVDGQKDAIELKEKQNAARTASRNAVRISHNAILFAIILSNY
jgi:DNA-binding GntR family transcriptional regulator